MVGFFFNHRFQIYYMAEPIVRRSKQPRVPLSEEDGLRLSEELKANRRTDSAGDVKYEYVIDRGLDSRGRGDYYTEGYNELHRVQFRDVVRELQNDFPGETLRGLDIGCGRGVAAAQLIRFSRDRPDMQTMEMHGTNVTRRETMLPKGFSHVMPAHRLDFDSESFHFVVSTEAATRHGKRLDLFLDEMYRVTIPGGRIFFQGTPKRGQTNLTEILEGFEDKHGVSVRHTWGDAYVIDKPKAADSQLLEVPYHWRKFRQPEAGGVTELWVVRDCGIPVHDLMPNRWCDQDRTRLSLHGDVYRTTTKDGHNIVYKRSHVGERMETGKLDKDSPNPEIGYNSPYEVMSVCRRLRDIGFGTIEQLAVVEVEGRTQLAPELRDDKKYDWLHHLRNPDGDPALKRDRVYYTLWRHADCIDARKALASGKIDAEEHERIVEEHSGRLAAAGIGLMTNISDRYLLLADGGEIRRGADGKPTVLLSNFNGLRFLDPVERLSPERRKILAEQIRHMRRVNREMFIADYETERGISGHGTGDEYFEGYNELHGVDFLEEIREHQTRFPHEDVRILDTSGGTRFATEVNEHFRQHPDEARIDLSVSGITRKDVHSESQDVDIVPWERLNRRFGPESFHMVIATESFGQYSGAFDVGLEESYGLLKPGGTLYWTRVPAVHNLPQKETQRILDEFERKHGTRVEKAEGALGYRVRKPG
ncbi:MAG: methyltransferase domain-containing protein [Candidatus Altiarchaeales archaeon]|nr:methyltransferase domain-containing protein [Candidatus Altiarchaeales archaeon]MBD3415860.1 methyltransferase domain-containing protein [Candidatus Altiarchaeales archaeon]